MTQTIPADAMGLWRREVITAPGFRDETTKVVWLQTQRCYADLRVKADRPAARGEAGFSGYADGDLIALGETQGFAGVLTVANGVCLWRRDMDCQPPGALPDEARYAIDGDRLIEDGIHADYQEIWRRDAESLGPTAAFALTRSDARAGLLVIAGRRMMEFIARPGPAPQGESLARLVADQLAAGRRDEGEALLASQIRYAALGGDGWMTELSSMPWFEGRPMWRAGSAKFDRRTGDIAFVCDGLAVKGRLLDASAPLDVVGRLFEESALVSRDLEGAEG